ncbi:BRCT domain-containing protein [Drepanopeziza brunnea f. sp. 'multigermtubi' MB_m1]|uniref:BRCT domain-containing protein n=1 Tax=Marssonina brunnea f. sp. multigermtubi (strain MB_m1) TaxID=1072389 RepID=K1WQI8_MARBU|nr:BRCT domain-containing protein [Drepanopeziza brunnea f. sp. 'multigermtubi' MB_m1]EKD19910.1 BRCT domain-containing protein [Drepanopeziza brunnea f. sp. 'multigermtubi' MB_m1]
MAEYRASKSRQANISLNASADIQAQAQAQAPLAGCVICCTSVPDEKRTQLAEYAKQMGASHTYDLTPEVTHLIVGDHDTEKYKYVAKNRMDVQPMTVAWVETMRELWINDQDIDMVSLEQEHRRPILQDLKFSMTGCDDPEERMQIAEMVRANGAIYEGDLTKSITHLISFRTEGAKYKAAKTWELQIVSIEWLRDSLERGMVLDEKLYDPALPQDERGLGAWNRTVPQRTSLGKRAREYSTATDGGKRKLRRTASTKLSTQNQEIWGDIVGAAAESSSKVAQVNRSGVWETNDDDTQNAYPPEPTAATEDDGRSRPTQSTVVNEARIDGIFSGCRFFLLGFPQEREDVLRQHLIPHDADVVDSVPALLSCSPSNHPKRLFRMVPHTKLRSDIPALPESQVPVDTVTYWWLERCLHQKRFIEPGDHVPDRPFPKLKIEGFEGVSVSSSAFTGIDLKQFERAVRMIGAEYKEDFTADTTMLVTKTLAGVRKDKYEYAQQWNVPIVRVEWIWDCIKAGEKISSSGYRCRSPKRTGSLPATREGSMSKPPSGHGRTSSDASRAPARANSHPSRASMRPPRHSRLDESAFASNGPGEEPSRPSIKPRKGSRLDNTAFDTGVGTPAADHSRRSIPSRPSAPDNTASIPDEPAEDPPDPSEPEPEEPSARDEPPLPTEPISKEEYETQGFPSLPAASAVESQDLAHKTQPLSEISNNSPSRSSRTTPAAPAPPDQTAPRQQEEMSNAISNLLAKAKTAPTQDAPEPRKRGRILGRVTSNMSAGSNLSRATSVDSTATHGHPVEYPPHNSNDQTANEKIQMLLNGDKAPAGVERQPPATQLQYEDPESTEAREMVMAKMRGEKVQRRSGIKEKAITLGDVGQLGRPTRRAAAGRGLG